MNSPTAAVLRLVSASAVSYFLPPLLVRGALSVLYRTFPTLQPSPRHARLVHYAIIWLYAGYLVLSSYTNLPVSLYDLLGLHPPACNAAAIELWKDTSLRPRWLSLVRIYHPDKSGGSEAAQSNFRELQFANEVLKNDVLRRAYERFGPSFVTKLSTDRLVVDRDALYLGILPGAGWYVVNLLIFIVIPMFSSRPDKKTFWRFSTLLWLLAIELALVISPQTHHSLFRLHTLLVHESVTLLRQCWFAFNIMLSHLPYLSEQSQHASPLAAKMGPLLSSIAIRSDVSAMTLDNMIRREVNAAEDKEAAIDDIVTAMGNT